ncbi:MAG: hypothetical protein AB8B99_16960 [Phormidesmis sp.]
MATFVCIIGNVEQGIFKLGIADDPLGHLASLQEGNPHKLSLISKVRLKDQNSALMVEGLGRKLLSQYEGMGQWYLNVPSELSSQFMSDDYLMLLASGAGAAIAKNNDYAIANSTTAFHRLSRKAQQQGLSFDDVLSRVEQAYDEGIAIDQLF